jgi:hypothetical protein
MDMRSAAQAAQVAATGDVALQVIWLVCTTYRIARGHYLGVPLQVGWLECARVIVHGVVACAAQRRQHRWQPQAT